MSPNPSPIARDAVERRLVGKVYGFDVEVAAWIEERGRGGGRPSEATRRLLAELPGYPRRRGGGTAIEWDRRYSATTGGSFHEDSSRLELNTPEQLDAGEGPACHLATLRLVAEAMEAANRRRDGAARVRVSAAVSDGQASWGHHFNLLTSRGAYFDPLFGRKPHLLGALATHPRRSRCTTRAGSGISRGAPSG